jgi:hypothetical protein
MCQQVAAAPPRSAGRDSGLSFIKPIKSKRRVADHGEVFTPQCLVEKMLDMVKGETERIDDAGLCKACIGNSDDRNARVCRNRGKLPCNGVDVLLKLALACRPLYGFGLGPIERNDHIVLILGSSMNAQ